MLDIFRLRRKQNSKIYSQDMIATVHRRGMLFLVQRAFQIYSLLKKLHSNAEYTSMNDMFINRVGIGIPTS